MASCVNRSTFSTSGLSYLQNNRKLASCILTVRWAGGIIAFQQYLYHLLSPLPGGVSAMACTVKHERHAAAGQTARYWLAALALSCFFLLLITGAAYASAPRPDGQL